MIYLVILFSKSSTSESHSLGLGKDVHACGPSHTGSWARIAWAFEFKTYLGSIIQPSLKEKGLVGWGYSLEKLENFQFQLTRKQKQLEEQFRIWLYFLRSEAGTRHCSLKIVKALLELLRRRFIKHQNRKLHPFLRTQICGKSCFPDSDVQS